MTGGSRSSPVFMSEGKPGSDTFQIISVQNNAGKKLAIERYLMLLTYTLQLNSAVNQSFIESWKHISAME